MYVVAAANSETGDILPMTEEGHNVYMMCVILTQYILNKGLKKFGDRGKQAVVEELISLKDG